MDKKLVGVIEKASDGGYGIYALEDVIPVTGYGLTECRHPYVLGAPGKVFPICPDRGGGSAGSDRK